MHGGSAEDEWVRQPMIQLVNQNHEEKQGTLIPPAEPANSVNKLS